MKCSRCNGTGETTVRVESQYIDRWRAKLMAEIYRAYGASCQWCGCSDPDRVLARVVGRANGSSPTVLVKARMAGYPAGMVEITCKHGRHNTIRDSAKLVKVESSIVAGS